MVWEQGGLTVVDKLKFSKITGSGLGVADEEGT